MAYIKTVTQTIKNENYVFQSISYISSPVSKINNNEKCYKVSYNLCVSDTPSVLANEFKNTRIAFNKNDKILSHQLVQSFAKDDNITPELAHKIGLELIEKTMLKKFQIVMSTHIDTECVHNQFIINSVSPIDGKKFLDNKKTISLLRKKSDELCYKYNLSVIDDGYVSKYSPIDQATKQTAYKGKSWKIQLVKDIDTALENCKSKDEFIEFFKSLNYEIQYTDKNITFKKIGEKKGIRADTLAKQFGQKYSKKSIDKKLNVKNTQKNKTSATKRTAQQTVRYFDTLSLEEWEKFKKQYKVKNDFKINNSYYFSSVFFSRNPFIFTLRLLRYLFCRNTKVSRLRTYEKYKVTEYNNQKVLTKIIGSISYGALINAPSENCEIKLYSYQIAKLLNDNIILSAKVNVETGTGIVTVKRAELKNIAKFLNINYEQLSAQANNIDTRKKQHQLKRKNGKLSYLILNTEQVSQLKLHCIDIVCYEKGEDNFNVAFSPFDKEKVLNCLYPNYKQDNPDSFYIRNAKLNQKIKKKAKATGEKICYKIVLSNQYKTLKETALEFAVFRQKDGKYNVVFLESDKSKIEKVLRGDTNVENSTSSYYANKKL